jgi:hypothetical protein
MNREKGYDVAVKMFQLEAERWAKNALGLVAALAAIFVGCAQLKDLSPYWPFFLSSIVSAAGVLIALSIRGTTDAWKATVKAIEGCPEKDVFLPFYMFENNLHKDTPCKDFKKMTFFWKDGWNKEDVFFSVTRVYTLLFAMAAGFFLVIGLWLFVGCHS